MVTAYVMGKILASTHHFGTFLQLPPAPQRAYLIFREAHLRLVRDEKIQPTEGEILNFLEVLVLGTRFDFGSRAELWAYKRNNQFIPLPNIGSTTQMSWAKSYIL